MILNKKKSMLIILIFVMSIGILNFNFKNVHSIDTGSEQEYEQYVLAWIAEFVRVQEESPLIFSIETKYLDTNREAIQARIRTINNFQYVEERIPDKYKDIHKEVLEVLAVYKVAYENLYIAIATGDSRAVGENVGKLYESDIVLERIRNALTTQ